MRNGNHLSCYRMLVAPLCCLWYKLMPQPPYSPQPQPLWFLALFPVERTLAKLNVVVFTQNSPCLPGFLQNINLKRLCWSLQILGREIWLMYRPRGSGFRKGINFFVQFLPNKFFSLFFRVSNFSLVECKHTACGTLIIGMATRLTRKMIRFLSWLRAHETTTRILAMPQSGQIGSVGGVGIKERLPSPF